MSNTKIFDNTIPVTKTVMLSGKAVMYQLTALQTEYLAVNFNTTLGNVLKDDVTSRFDNSEEQIIHYPAYNLCLFSQALQRNFFQYVLHHMSFRDTPVLAQYEFTSDVDKYVNIFVLGGSEKFMYIIYEDYQNDKVLLQLVDALPHVGRIRMEKTANSPVKKVSDIWNYHYNAKMAFEVF